jgi:glycosyltransferase involved in cell wall biosynthesis
VARDGRKRITVVTDAILGVVKTGGSGTANTHLSFALAAAGHVVELLVTSSRPVRLDERWSLRYAERGIGVHVLDPPRNVVPGALGLTVTVQEALERDPPDVVVIDAWSGSGYMALRLRDLGLAFQETTFIVVCNGPTAWAYETDRKLPRSYPAFEIEAIERASAELADAVVSPSRVLLDWLVEHGWKPRRSFVAPYFTHSDGGTRAEFDGRLRRIAFFGRLEERKGLTPFLSAVNALDDGALAGIELAFVGRATPRLGVDDVAGRLSERVKTEVSGVRFETELDQPEAIAFLKQPGTIAVMPSLLDNSPNVVYECLENGIPFLAGRVGGVPELIADEDREHALVEPTPAGIRAGLERVLGNGGAIRPVRPAFDNAATHAVWEEALAISPSVRSQTESADSIRVSAAILALHRGEDLERCLDALAAQSRAPAEVVVAVGPDTSIEISSDGRPWRVTLVRASASTSSELRAAAVRACREDFVLLLEDRDELDDRCAEALVRSLLTSEADVVTCAVQSNGKRNYFLGEPNELGLVGNYYGLIGLCRRSVLDTAVVDTGGDNDWVLYATVALNGAKIVSVPRPLARTDRAAGNPLSDPIGSGAALAVVRAFEGECPPQLRELPRLAASLAARRTGSILSPSFAARLRWIWEHEGPAGVARRLRRNVSARPRL